MLTMAMLLTMTMLLTMIIIWLCICPIGVNWRVDIGFSKKPKVKIHNIVM